jgi:O-methyltransferase
MTINELIIKECSKYSMISTERFHNNIDMVKYVESNEIPGDIVEIGVWKGGSILSMIIMYEITKKISRNFHLYDTFDGMTDPTNIDVDIHNHPASLLMKVDTNILCKSSLDEVKTNIKKYTNILPNYHVGDIIHTTVYPEKIAILRLDTDWYESTKFELDNFYDKVVPGGVVIIDDYGHWQGCRKAVDEFLAVHPYIKLNVIDNTGVYFFKPNN